jgi:hypothetical protein
MRDLITSSAAEGASVDFRADPDGHVPTEAEWLQCDDDTLLAYFVADRMSLRKLRLALVAVCRRVEHHLLDHRSRYALEVCEAHADGLASEAALAEARSQAEAAYKSLLPHANTPRDAEFMAALSVSCATGTERDVRVQSDMIDIALFAPGLPPDSIPPERRAASVADANLARDVFGNPFRPVDFAPPWRTDTAVSLARHMYNSRDFAAMPILADALQDAGCEDAELLAHCRGPGPHVRGCWVVDMVLGKE